MAYIIGWPIACSVLLIPGSCSLVMFIWNFLVLKHVHVNDVFDDYWHSLSDRTRRIIGVLSLNETENSPDPPELNKGSMYRYLLQHFFFFIVFVFGIRQQFIFSETFAEILFLSSLLSTFR